MGVLALILEFLIAAWPTIVGIFTVLLEIYEVLKVIAGMTALLAVLVGLFEILFDPRGAQRVGNFLSNLVKGAVSNVTPLITDLAPNLQTIEKAVVSSINTFGGPIASDVQAAVAPIVKAAYGVTVDALTTAGPSTPANATTVASDAMADAFGNGLGSFAVTTLFQALFPENLNVLNGAGPILAQMAGFDEVAAAVRDPLYRAAFGRSLEYQFNSIFKPDFLTPEIAARLFARGLITQAQLDEAFQWSALKAEYTTPISEAAYNPVSPRALATAFVDVNFPTAQVQAMMEFAGNRPADIQVMLTAFNQRSTQNVRQQYLNALISAAENGEITTAELQTDLGNLDFAPDAVNFVLLTVATKRLQQLTTLYRKSISEGYQYGQVSDADYVPQLEAIGINSADAQAHYAVDSIKKLGKEAVAAAKAEASAEAKAQRAAVSAAHAQFQAGDVDLPGFAAALALAGLPAQIVVYATEVAQAKQLGSMENVFGTLQTHANATLLKEQVAAIGEQVYKGLLTPTLAIGQLANLGIPGPNREALIAYYAAEGGLPIIPS